MDDPYFEFKLEIESSLNSLIKLHSNYLKNGQNDSNNLLKEEISNLISNLNLDLIELKEIINSLEESKSKQFNHKEEIIKRKSFLNKIQSEIIRIKLNLDLDQDSVRSNDDYHPRLNQYNDDEEEEDENPEEEFELQHQSILMEQQDRTLTDISGTVNLLREQAKVMGREVFDQNAMLEDLDSHLDSTSNKLSKAQRRMGNFVRQNQSSPASWCIFILIIVLTLLLVFILFF